ncbi:MAG: helix-turn-helix domain-containing protein [Thaumarchaeota archaeon]|nr:helix-turn-helix domain-containing protein [Nitrososphaerota archaeon]
MSDEAAGIGKLLDILGNETRRRILEVLADEPKYFIQLSRELGVSQQAVLKHLTLLEDAGLITSFRAKSELAAPDRKYYRLNRSLYLSIGIMGDAVELALKEIRNQERLERVQQNDVVKRFRADSQSILEETDNSSIIGRAENLLNELDSRVERLEEEKIALLAIKEEIMQMAHRAIRESLEEDLHRRIMYQMFGRESVTIDELAEILNTREKEIRAAVDTISGRFVVRITE